MPPTSAKLTVGLTVVFQCGRLHEPYCQIKFTTCQGGQYVNCHRRTARVGEQYG
nr:MAG TPA: hypothetical protein [Caudoviricetes sp.]DAZ64247.1 MAG TPA: hypothetical protein [Caudoviricetes sp.]